ncbi:hypothetical protein NFI96_027890 [Prochilodus magdalenae]|nr:hypothetical protein NFI96_027890 [Prochilodus magdalenae]
MCSYKESVVLPEEYPEACACSCVPLSVLLLSCSGTALNSALDRYSLKPGNEAQTPAEPLSLLRVMANVEVQSVLERHAARRTFPLLARTKVCRNLFGPVDHEELNREMKQKLQEISDAERSRWNFNFEQDSPLPGNYEWEEVGARCLPAFYRDSVRCGAKARTASPLHEKECEGKSAEQAHERPAGEVNQENQSGALNGTSPCARKQRRTRSVPETARNTSTHITDFFPRRKRPADWKQPESSSMPVEVTPRKRIR